MDEENKFWLTTIIGGCSIFAWYFADIHWSVGVFGVMALLVAVGRYYDLPKKDHLEEKENDRNKLNESHSLREPNRSKKEVKR